MWKYTDLQMLLTLVEHQLTVNDHTQTLNTVGCLDVYTLC